MSRSRRRTGRAYQPYPSSRSSIAARLVVVLVGVALLVGIVALAVSR
ncbi:MAG: hypothetical protein M3Y88_05325 [Chloroflexota bacterium]|nr:hypothetical protein [Chloroflexota bacterium]